MKIEIAGHTLNPSAIVGIGPLKVTTTVQHNGCFNGPIRWGFDLITTGIVHTVKCSAEDEGPLSFENTARYEEVAAANKKSAEADRQKIVDAIFGP